MGSLAQHKQATPPKSRLACFPFLHAISLPIENVAFVTISIQLRQRLAVAPKVAVSALLTIR